MTFGKLVVHQISYKIFTSKIIYNKIYQNIFKFAHHSDCLTQAINGHDGVAVALLKHGADVTMIDENGLTPVEVAKTKKIKSTLKQAWAEATEYKPPAKTAQDSGANSKPPTEARPVAPPRRKKAKGEVIFDVSVHFGFVRDFQTYSKGYVHFLYFGKLSLPVAKSVISAGFTFSVR